VKTPAKLGDADSCETNQDVQVAFNSSREYPRITDNESLKVTTQVFRLKTEG